MKQIRVTSPFLDSTVSNKRREVGEIFLANEDRAANLVNGKFCEYVKEEEEKKPASQSSAGVGQPSKGEQQKPKASEPKKPVTTKSERK